MSSPALPNVFLDLVTEWREQASAYARDGARVSGSAILQRNAAELEAAWESYQLEELSVSQAAEESGYSEDHLRSLVRDGKIPDDRPEGSQGEIRIRRRDLPKKPTRRARPQLSVVDAMADRLRASRR